MTVPAPFASELLAIAATLEHAHDPDAACVAQLHELLANGCNSSLYNSDIHVSELRATLYAVRAGISPDRPRSGSTWPRPAVGHTSRPKLKEGPMCPVDSTISDGATTTPSTDTELA